MTEPITPATSARIIGLADQSIEVAEEGLNQFVALRRRLLQKEATADVAVHNAVEFSYLLQFDFNCLLIEFVRYTGSSRGSVYGRLLVLLIHESTRTLQSILGRQFQIQLAATIGRDDALAECRALHRLAVELHRHSQARYGDVRDGILAHRDADPEIRLRLIAMTHDHQAVGDLVTRMQEVVLRLARLTAEYVRVLAKQADAKTSLMPPPPTP